MSGVDQGQFPADFRAAKLGCPDRQWMIGIGPIQRNGFRDKSNAQSPSHEIEQHTEVRDLESYVAIDTSLGERAIDDEARAPALLEINEALIFQTGK